MLISLPSLSLFSSLILSFSLFLFSSSFPVPSVYSIYVTHFISDPTRYAQPLELPLAEKDGPFRSSTNPPPLIGRSKPSFAARTVPPVTIPKNSSDSSENSCGSGPGMTRFQQSAPVNIPTWPRG